MSFKRFYAFEAEGVSDEVKAQLEAVEKQADEKCESAADCDKILNKIDTQAQKFDAALSDMAGAAKDCKDGKCDADAMASRITPAQAELKEVAKTIGVASEAEGVTEEELKDVKDYLEGAKEIVEAKKDELGSGDAGDSKDTKDSGDGDTKKDEPKDDGKKDDGADAKEDAKDEGDAAEESDMDLTIDDLMAVEMFGMCADEVDYCLEAYMDTLDTIGAGAMSMAAMEGANMDAIATVKQYLNESKAAKAEMKAAVKAKDYKTAATKAREVAGYAGKMQSSLSSIPPSVTSAVLVPIAIALTVLIATGQVGKLAGKAGGAIKQGSSDLAKKAGEKVAAFKEAHPGDVAKKGSKAAAKMINDGVAADGGKAGVGAAIRNAGKNVKEAAGNAKGAVSGAVTGAKGRVKDAWDSIPENEKAAKAKFAVRNAVSGAGKAASTAKAGAAKAGKIIAIGGTAGAAVTGTASTVMGDLKKIKAVDENGNPTGAKLNANDFNILIGTIKGAAAAVKKHYEKLASDYEKMASGAATESEVLDIFYPDDVVAAYESVVAGDTDGAEPAQESETSSIDSFVEACESLMIGGKSANGSFLFGD